MTFPSKLACVYTTEFSASWNAANSILHVEAHYNSKLIKEGLNVHSEFE